LGTPVVYCADHPATALLEMLVRIARSDAPRGFRLLAIDVPDNAAKYIVGDAVLDSDWRTTLTTTQRLGTALLEHAEYLMIFVPCVLVPAAQNVLLNPRHPEAARCAIAEIIQADLDPRLIH
jgi:RES domain-containing protein